MKGKYRQFFVTAAMIQGIMLTAAPAVAQDGQSAETSGADDNGAGSGEIIVTAQRRGESLQRVPIAIDAFGSKQFQKLGIADTKDLQAKVPALTVSTAGPQLVFLRGIGTSGSSVQAEQSVASYIDGVYLYASWGNQVPVGSLARVEVLKGPQGTLFGRNTTGGVIQMVTRDPMDGKALEGGFGYGNYDTVDANAYVALAPSDKFAISLALDYHDQGDGWGFNAVSAVDTYKTQTASAQLKAVFKPTETTKITGFFWYNELNSTGFLTQPVLVPHGRYESLADTSNLEQTKSYLGYLRIDQDLGFANLVSITSARQVRSQFNYDYDSLPLPIIDSHLTQPTRNFSQEVQLVSPDASPVKWLVGAYYFNGRANYQPISLRGLGLAPLSRIDTFNEQKVRSGALFGQVTVPIGPDTNVTGGLRYTLETAIHPEGYTTLGEGTVIITTPEQRVKSNGATWRLSIDHKLAPETMVYASWNRGLKSGGFSLANSTNLPPVKPEKLDAYEIGLKTSLFDRRLRLNVAGFLYKFRDIQVLSANGTVIATVNAARATMKGVDGDLTLDVTPWLSLYGSAGYLDGRYGKFDNAILYALDGTVTVGSAQGKRTIYSPELTAATGATITVPVASDELVFNAYLQHLSKQYVGPANVLEIPAHTTVNAQVSWEMANGVTLQVWGKNIFDSDYVDNGLETAFGAYEVPGAPRTYGMKLNFAF